jgi:hypothetical protein
MGNTKTQNKFFADEQYLVYAKNRKHAEFTLFLTEKINQPIAKHLSNHDIKNQ